MMKLHCEPSVLVMNAHDFSAMHTFCPKGLERFANEGHDANNYARLHELVDKIPTVRADSRGKTGLLARLLSKKG